MVRKRMAMLIAALAAAIILAVGGGEVMAAGNTAMLAKVKTGQSSAKLSWKKVSGANRYVVYFHSCDGKTLKNKVKTLKAGKTSYTKKGLSSSKDYKFMVVAQKKNGSKYEVLAKSRTIHVVTTKNEKKTNVKSVAITPASLQLFVGDTVTLKAKTKKAASGKKLLGKSHGAALVWSSGDPAVATVDQSGKLTAVAEGSCMIYASSISGVWGTASVTVRKSKGAAAPEKEDGAVEKYTVTYEYTGDVPKGAPAVHAEKTYEAGAAVEKQTAPTLAGYTFSGWDGEVTKMPKKDVTVSGYWKANKHKVNFKYADPTNAGKEVVTSVSYAYGEKVSAIADPDVKGYEFDGWKNLPATMPDKDVDVEGTFTKICKVNVILLARTWDANEALSPFDPWAEAGNEEHVWNYHFVLASKEFEVKAGEKFVRDFTGDKIFTDALKKLDAGTNRKAFIAYWGTDKNEFFQGDGDSETDAAQMVDILLNDIGFAWMTGDLDQYKEAYGIPDPPYASPQALNQAVTEAGGSESDGANAIYDQMDNWLEMDVYNALMKALTDPASPIGKINDNMIILGWALVPEPTES